MECWFKSVLVCWVSIPSGLTVTDGVLILMTQAPPLNVIHNSDAGDRCARRVEGYMTFATALELLIEDTGLMTVHVNETTLTLVTEEAQLSVNEQVGPYYNYGSTINDEANDLQSARVGRISRAALWEKQQGDRRCARHLGQDGKGQHGRHHEKDQDSESRAGCALERRGRCAPGSAGQEQAQDEVAPGRHN